MADTKITELGELTSVASGDKLYVVDVSDITDGANGSSKQITRSNLVSGLATSGANSDITSLTGLTTALSVAQGGTAATSFTASQLIRLNSGGTALESSGKTVPTGDIVGTTDTQTLTNKTLTSPKINEDVAITATATELNYVDGVTSAIQTQIDTKAPTASPTFTGTVNLPVVQGTGFAAKFMQAKGLYDIGAAGATETIDWSNGDRQIITLDENITIDFSNPAPGQTLTLFMLQDGTGTNTISWTPTITWADNTEPTWTTTANKMNIAIITYANLSYYGVGNAFA